ncbi:MAG TPA: hypothetical protein VGN93_28155 [Shinella sp.]|uniref:hypothetical protein n=1 Tax=Shinella sp. TaxID=1870904 RepID=UPI002E1507A6|nr:hypothetical protein [Shinella sp.]
MAQPETTRPTLATIRKQARASGITIAPEREKFVLAGAQHLHEAAQRLGDIAADETPR